MMNFVQRLADLGIEALKRRDGFRVREAVMQREFERVLADYSYTDDQGPYITFGYGCTNQLERLPMKKVQFLFNLDRAVKMSGKYDGGRRHNRTEAVALLCDAIPLSHTDRDHLYEGNPVRIVCTPEQFTRYLINRCTAGYLNCFRELEVREAFTPTMPRIIYARESAEDVGDLP